MKINFYSYQFCIKFDLHIRVQIGKPVYKSVQGQIEHKIKDKGSLS